MKRIQARYNGTCSHCRDEIVKWDEICWSKRTGALHLECAEAQARGEAPPAFDYTEYEDQHLHEVDY